MVKAELCLICNKPIVITKMPFNDITRTKHVYCKECWKTHKHMIKKKSNKPNFTYDWLRIERGSFECTFD